MKRCETCELNEDLLCLKYGMIVSDDWECPYIRRRRNIVDNNYISYQEQAARTINPALTSFGLKNHALHGIAGEVGEIHSMYQKTYQGHELNEEHLKKEFGDLLWFIAEYCTAFNWNMDEIMDMNIKKLEERYPEGFDTEKSIHRKEGDI